MKIGKFLFKFYFGCIASSLPHRLFSSCHEPGDTFVVVHGLLVAVVFLLWNVVFRAHGPQ